MRRAILESPPASAGPEVQGFITGASDTSRQPLVSCEFGRRLGAGFDLLGVYCQGGGIRPKNRKIIQVADLRLVSRPFQLQDFFISILFLNKNKNLGTIPMKVFFLFIQNRMPALCIFSPQPHVQ
jgi:hypothetical protein